MGSATVEYSGSEGTVASDRNRLRDLLAKKALIHQKIQLSGGGESNYYFDCRKLTLSAEGMPLVADALLDHILTLDDKPTAIGGLTVGADPIVAAVVMRGPSRGIQLDGFLVHKEPKKHGTQKLIENEPATGSKVVIVDDVVTSGSSVIQAIRIAEEAGCEVVLALCLIERNTEGGEKVRESCENYEPLFTLEDFPEVG